MFPNNKYRELYCDLERCFGERRRDREYLEILLLASEEGEKKVIGIVEKLLNTSVSVTSDRIKEKLNVTVSVPFQNSFTPELSSYNLKNFRIG